jgi:hypothetical protein
MSELFIFCPKCFAKLPPSAVNAPEPLLCPSCGVTMMMSVFPALYRRIESGSKGELVVGDAEAGCFYHPHKKAAAVCATCGRFLCALCDVDFNGQHLCPPCIETAAEKKRVSTLENRRVLYDSAALGLAVLPVFTVIFTIVTAPMAIYVAIRYWNTPGSIVRRGKTRFVLAILIAGRSTRLVDHAAGALIG